MEKEIETTKDFEEEVEDVDRTCENEHTTRIADGRDVGLKGSEPAWWVERILAICKTKKGKCSQRECYVEWREAFPGEWRHEKYTWTHKVSSELKDEFLRTLRNLTRGRVIYFSTKSSCSNEQDTSLLSFPFRRREF